MNGLVGTRELLNSASIVFPFGKVLIYNAQNFPSGVGVKIHAHAE